MSSNILTKHKISTVEKKCHNIFLNVFESGIPGHSQPQEPDWNILDKFDSKCEPSVTGKQMWLYAVWFDMVPPKESSGRQFPEICTMSWFPLTLVNNFLDVGSASAASHVAMRFSSPTIWRMLLFVVPENDGQVTYAKGLWGDSYFEKWSAFFSQVVLEDEVIFLHLPACFPLSGCEKLFFAVCKSIEAITITFGSSEAGGGWFWQSSRRKDEAPFICFHLLAGRG